LFKIAELEIWLVCMETRRVFFIHCWLGVWTEPGQWFSQPILHTSKGSLWGQTCCSCDIWQASAQACTNCKKNDI